MPAHDGCFSVMGVQLGTSVILHDFYMRTYYNLYIVRITTIAILLYEIAFSRITRNKRAI